LTIHILLLKTTNHLNRYLLLPLGKQELATQEVV